MAAVYHGSGGNVAMTDTSLAELFPEEYATAVMLATMDGKVHRDHGVVGAKPKCFMLTHVCVSRLHAPQHNAKAKWGPGHKRGSRGGGSVRVLRFGGGGGGTGGAWLGGGTGGAGGGGWAGGAGGGAVAAGEVDFFAPGADKGAAKLCICSQRHAHTAKCMNQAYNTARSAASDAALLMRASLRRASAAHSSTTSRAVAGYISAETRKLQKVETAQPPAHQEAVRVCVCAFDSWVGWRWLWLQSCRRANRRAARLLFHYYNPGICRSFLGIMGYAGPPAGHGTPGRFVKVDLHGLQTIEAASVRVCHARLVTVAIDIKSPPPLSPSQLLHQIFVTKTWCQHLPASTRTAEIARMNSRVRLVTGRGSHSGARGPVVKRMVQRWCSSHGLKVVRQEEGFIEVVLR